MGHMLPQWWTRCYAHGFKMHMVISLVINECWRIKRTGYQGQDYNGAGAARSMANIDARTASREAARRTASSRQM